MESYQWVFWRSLIEKGTQKGLFLGPIIIKGFWGILLIVCGDPNCHIHEGSDGFEVIHGGHGFGIRKAEGTILNVCCYKPCSCKLPLQDSGLYTYHLQLRWHW